MPDYEIQNGVHCANFIGGDQNITYGFGVEDVERLIEKALGFMQAGEIFLPAQHDPEILQAEHNGEKLIFFPGAARQLANQSQERAYLLSLSIDQEYQRWATRFVPLAGKMDVRQVVEGLPISFTEFIIPGGEGGLGAQPTQRPLKDITEAMDNHGAFVILGDPGAGKTTTMQKVAFDAACGRLQKPRGKIPLFVRLSQQGERDPYAFLQTEWERRTGLPFRQALKDGCILILADGINEIPRDKRNDRLKDWMLFEAQYRGANQLIFSGREKDYDNQLNLPRVQVEPLDEARVREFLQKHKAEGLAELLDDPVSKLDEMARNPLNLFVLAMVYLRGGKNLQALANRGKLFQSFTLELMAHEQLWHPDALSVDAKTELFARLAYEMQKQGSGTTFAAEAARDTLPGNVSSALGEQLRVDREAVLRFGRGATILDPATIPDVRFYHHLLQEYFAARELLRRFNSGEDLSAFWKTPRTQEEMPPADVGEWDPLPEPPTTGWEVTTILACGLSNDPAKLIEAVRQHNPELAGRCLDEAGIECKDWQVCKDVRSDLLAELYNPAIHLRARLQAGFILGRIDDPRFSPALVRRGGGDEVKVILPQMVKVPAGKYLIGSAKEDQDSFENEFPQHTVDLPAFSIGKWSVTNAEYACFMKAGGYENEAYWQGNLAKRWLHGEEVSGGPSKAILDGWRLLKETPGWQERLKDIWSPDQIKAWEELAKMSEEQVGERLSKEYSQKSRSQPAYWHDRAHNNPSQPVVGVTWFEGRAYCAWLSDVTGKNYRLPTEVEWEAAARGLPVLAPLSLLGRGTRNAGKVRKYPWGNNWDADKANSLEGRVLKPSPVGAYAAAGGKGAFDAEDQAGNVYEWTSSLFLPYPYRAEKSEGEESTAERVVRGGSWGNYRRVVRCAYRYWFVPGLFNDIIGFRYLSPGSDSSGC